MPILHRAVAAVAMMLSPSSLAAQERDSLPGPVIASDTVRLRENRTVLVQGILLRRDSTGLVVVDRRTRDTVHIPLFQITRSEVQRGSHRQGDKVAMQGVAAGAAIGTILAVLAVTSSGKGDDALRAVVAALAALVSTGAGALVGLLASYTSTETWYPFDPASVASQ